MKLFVLQVAFLWLKFAGIVCVSSIISSKVITESSIIFAKYLPFLQVYVAGFQIKCFSHTWQFFGFLHSHQHLSLFYFWFELHFLPSNLDSFIPGIILKALRFKSSVLLGMLY